MPKICILLLLCIFCIIYSHPININVTFDCNKHIKKCFNTTDTMIDIQKNIIYTKTKLYNGIMCNNNYTICSCTKCRYNIIEEFDYLGKQFCRNILFARNEIKNFKVY